MHQGDLELPVTRRAISVCRNHTLLRMEWDVKKSTQLKSNKFYSEHSVQWPLETFKGHSIQFGHSAGPTELVDHVKVDLSEKVEKVSGAGISQFQGQVTSKNHA